MEFQLIDAFIYAMDRLALATVIGCGATGAWLIVDNEQRAIATTTLRRLIEIALSLLVITTLAVLLLRTAALADVGISETGPYLSRVIGDSDFGALWLGRITVLLVLIATWLVARREITTNSALLLLGGGAITAFLISSASHAGDEGIFTFDNLINTTHIITGCLWGGAIVAYLNLLKQMHHLPVNVIATSATRLSSVATVALTAVLTTGLINSWHRFEALSQLWISGYGITLLIKLSFVITMMMLGAFNRFYAVPAITKMQTNASQLLQRVLYIDTLLFLIVIGSAAALGMQSPSH